MKRILLILFCFISSISFGQTIYYVATTGSDANPGTLAQPFATLEALDDVMTPGDTAYIRGGRYKNTKTAATDVLNHLDFVDGTITDTIKIYNYPTESPVFYFGDTLHTGMPIALYLHNSKFVHLKGLRFTGLKQNPSGNVLSGFNLTNMDSCLIERVEVDSMGMYGFVLDNSDGNTFLNCDSHHNADPYSTPAYENTNGFNCTGGGNTSTNNTFKNCRSWWNGDDGWDFYGVDGKFTLENCWAFFNGYIPGTFTTAGNGCGFKLGPMDGHNDDTLRTLINCIAVRNRTVGFSENDAHCIIAIYHSLSYGHTGAGTFGYFFGHDMTITHLFNNDISYSNRTDWFGGITPGTYNTWNGGVMVTDADFVSLDTSLLDNARQADGGLPLINFPKLAAGSDLIDAGIGAGVNQDTWGYWRDANPDIGPHEYGDSVLDIPPNLPEVTTTTPIIKNARASTGGGNVTSTGGGTVSARGIVWATHINPNLTDNHTHNGTGTGTFTSWVGVHNSNDTIHVRAYATNEIGVVYGSDVEWRTPKAVYSSSLQIGSATVDSLFVRTTWGDSLIFRFNGKEVKIPKYNP